MSGTKPRHRLRLNLNLFSESSLIRLIIWTSLGFVIFISLLNITGWLNNIDFLKSIGTKWEDIKLISSICLLLIAISLVILFLDLNTKFFKILTKILTALLCLISFLTVSGYYFSFFSGHQLQYRGFMGNLFDPDKRMPTLTAISFLLIGCIIFLLDRKSRNSSNFAHILVIPVCLICYFTIASYMLGVYNATALNSTAVALFTGINLFAICLTILLLRPDTWFMKLFMIHDIAGLISRILILPVIIVPIVIGWVRIKAEAMSVVSFGESVVLETVTYTFAFIVLTSLTTIFVRRADRKKEASEQALRESEKRYRDLTENLYKHTLMLEDSEKKLAESNESYEELLSNARSIIVKFDILGRFIYINKFGLEFFGFEEREIIGKTALETIVPPVESTGRDLVKLIGEVYSDPDKMAVNINENIKKNGERSWIEWHNQTIFAENNQKTGHIAIGLDITERRKAEEALKESEQKLWSVLNVTQESIYMFDTNGIITMTNSTGVERLKKQSHKEVVGHHFSEFMSPATSELRQSKLDEVKKSGRSLQYEDKRAGIIFSHNFFPVFKDNAVTSIVTYSTDITKRKKAEICLKESEDRFRTIAESLPVLISIIDIKNLSLLFVNESTEKSFGFKKREMLNHSFADFFYNREIIQELGSELSQEGKIYNREIKVKRSDGTPFWIMTSINTINYINRAAFLTASIDITETKKTQDELMRLNRTLNAYSKSSQAMMHSKDEVNYLNEVCKIITEDCGHVMVWIGYAQIVEGDKKVKPMAFHGIDKDYIELMNIKWDNSSYGNGPTGKAIKTGKAVLCRDMETDPLFDPWREEARKRGYGSSLALPLIIDDEPFGSITIYSQEPDAFSYSETEMLSDLSIDLAYGISFIRLEESEKAAAKAIRENEIKLKELVATKDKFFNIVAHDLKNPFTSLLGSSELLYDNINQMTTDNVRKLAFILNDSAKSGFAILENLLDWSRSQTGLMKYNPEHVNLKNLIDENISNLQLQLIKKEISMKSAIQENLMALTDKNMLNTIIRNLMSNAVKYTHKNGTVTISASKLHSVITISVKDSGIGIPMEKVNTLFRLEKTLSLPGTENEQGTGLGLKLCKEFTEQIGGSIWVESNVGQGSDFKFTIPVRKHHGVTIQ